MMKKYAELIPFFWILDVKFTTESNPFRTKFLPSTMSARNPFLLSRVRGLRDIAEYKRVVDWNEVEQELEGATESSLISLVKEGRWTNDPYGNKSVLGELLLRHALLEAESQGEVWTPLLEELVRQRVWEDDKLEEREQGKASVENERFSYGVPTLETYIKGSIKVWARENEELAYLQEAVVGTTVHDITCCLISNAQLTEDKESQLIRQTLGRNQHAAKAWAEKELTKSGKNQLLDEFIEVAANIEKGRGEDSERKSVANDIRLGYVKLLEKNVSFTQEQIERLLEEARRQEEWKTPTDNRNSWESPVMNLLDYHVRYTNDHKVAKEFIKILSDYGLETRMSWLLDDEDTWRKTENLRFTHDLAVFMAQQAKNLPEVLQAISRRKDLRRKRVLREILLATDVPEVAFNLLKDERREEFPLLFRQMVGPVKNHEKLKDYVAGGQREDYLIQILKRHRDWAKEDLEPQDLEILLHSKNRETRMFVLHLLGEMRQDPTNISTQKSTGIKR